MNRATARILLLVALLFLAWRLASAQAPAATGASPQTPQTSAFDPFDSVPPLDDPEMIDMNLMPDLMRPGGSRQPYIADTEKEVTQVLADGTRITRKTSGHVARDSQGRALREMGAQESGTAGGRPPMPETIMIFDLSAHTIYTLLPSAKMAIKMVLPDTQELAKQMLDTKKAEMAAPKTLQDQPPQSSSEPSAESMARNPFFSKNTRTESLGEANLEGVITQGKRYTATIPAGAIGNDRPLEVTAERWYSKELQAVVMLRLNDPRKGEATFRLTNIRLDEPPASLFDIPSDYQVQEMKMPFGAFAGAGGKAGDKPSGNPPEKPQDND